MKISWHWKYWLISIVITSKAPFSNAFKILPSKESLISSNIIILPFDSQHPRKPFQNSFIRWSQIKKRQQSVGKRPNLNAEKFFDMNWLFYIHKEKKINVIQSNKKKLKNNTMFMIMTINDDLLSLTFVWR